jgi:hypothetical protein
MTDQRNAQPGYRGALAPRNDMLARPWVAVVIAAFLLMFVLSFLGFPGVLFPDDSASPSPSVPPPSLSLEPSGSAAPSVQASEAPVQ